MNDLFAESGRQATHGHFMTTPAGSGQSRIGLAVKLLNADPTHNRNRVARFEAEALALSRLRHPATLKLVDFGCSEDGRPFLVSQLLAGESLAARIGRVGPLAPAQVRDFMAQTLDALIEAHDQGIVHRDLKPENLFVEPVNGRDVVRILDFGIALLAQQDLRLTEEGSAPGTVYYMSPEQVRGEAVDDRSDLYSVGVVAYECLTGAVPFDGPNALTISMKHLEAEPPALPAAVPADLTAWVSRCLAKLPDDRPETAAEALAELNALQLDVAPSPPQPKQQRTRTAQLLVLAVVLAVGSWWLGRQTVEGIPMSQRAAAPTVDAHLPDARLPDAHVPDARVPDARVPDAAQAPSPVDAAVERAPRQPQRRPIRRAPSTPSAPLKPPPGLY
jgi:serine/threonine-protein kinase